MGREPDCLDPKDKKSDKQRAGIRSTSHLVSLRDNPRAIPCDPSGGIVILRPVASLFFGNAEFLVERMEALLHEAETESKNKGKGRSVSTGDDVKAAVGAGKDTSNDAANENIAQPGARTAVTRFVLLDVSGIRLLDLPALAALGEVVDSAAENGTRILLSDATKKMKASLQACGLWRRVGGPLVMHSTEEVFALLRHAPSLVPSLSAESLVDPLQAEVGHAVV